jgi:PAS domain S-box-containing protein
MHGINVDITEQKRAEEAVRESEMGLRALFRQAPGFMCVLSGRTHVFEFANDSYRRLVGERPLLGKTMAEAFPELRGQGFFELLDQVYQTEQAVSRRETPLKLRRTADGPLEHLYIDFIYQPVKSAAGKITGIFVEGFEVTERVEAQRAVRERSVQFQTLLDEAPLGVYLVDSTLRIRAANPTARALFGGVELMGRDLAELLMTLWPARADDVIGKFRHTLETGEPYELSEGSTASAESGEPIYFEWRIHRIPLMDSQPGVVCYFRDISAQVQARVALERADQQKDEFLAMLAHELRNPLAPIVTASQLLARVPGQDAHSQASVAVIRRQVGHLTRLVDDLLDVSRITRGRIDLQRDFVDLTRVIAQAVEMVQPQVREKRHRLSVTTTGALPVYVLGDFARLVQCVGNLLTNAIKYTEPGGQISVRTSGDTLHEVVIEVTDDGVGITPGLLPRVFDLFVQSDRTLDRAQGGLGIGLAVVRRLVEMQGGEVTARSPGEGRGSTFSIRLPRVSRPASDSVEVASPSVVPRRVLVVDDNEDAAEMLAALLRSDGHEVHTVYRGSDALKRVQTFVPHVALLDIGLPEMDGYDLAQRMRRLPQLRDVRLVALTGYGQADDRLRTQAAGFDDHLVKPVEPSALRQVLAMAEGR